jgi:hypothetical protein
MSSFFPFHAAYWLDRHSSMERELQRARIAFCQGDNAFLTVDDWPPYTQPTSG